MLSTAHLLHNYCTLTSQARCCGAPIRSSSSPPLCPTARPSSRRYKGHYLSSYNHTLHDLTLPLYPIARPSHHNRSHYRTLSLQARRGARSADVLPRGTGAAPLLLCGRVALVVTCFHVAQSDHVAILAAHRGWTAARDAGGNSAGSRYCDRHFLSERAMHGNHEKKKYQPTGSCMLRTYSDKVVLMRSCPVLPLV